MANEEKDPLDVDAAVEALNRALPLQLRSATVYAIAAGSMVGFQFAGLAEALHGFAREELDDARRLVEKIVTLGGEPAQRVAPFDLTAAPARVVERLVEYETEAAEALQDVIPSTGHTAESEALEHRLEHIIMRKREQVDALLRALHAHR